MYLSVVYVSAVELFFWEKTSDVIYVKDWDEGVSLQKTTKGILLTKDDWEEVCETMDFLTKINSNIRDATLCSEGLDQFNQMGLAV